MVLVDLEYWYLGCCHSFDKQIVDVDENIAVDCMHIRRAGEDIVGIDRTEEDTEVDAEQGESHGQVTI